MRYRSARTAPGVKPPTGIGSDEIRPPACGATARDAAVSATVGNENEMMAYPQTGQKRLSAAILEEQEGHRMTNVCIVYSSAARGFSPTRRRHRYMSIWKRSRSGCD